MKPLVSVIIPTYNNAELLKRAVKSLINQTFNKWEAIIIDNSSTDSTEEVIKNFNDRRIKFFSVNNNGIIAYSRNFGIKQSSSNIIAFLDSDDWWTKDKLEISIKYLNYYELVYHDLYIYNQNNLKNKYLSKSKNLTGDIFKKLLLNGNCIPNSSVVVKKNKLEEIGLIDEDINKFSWEDYDTWLKLAKNKTKFKRLRRILGYYWVGQNNTTNENQIKLNNKNFVTIYKESLLKYGIKNDPWWCSYLLGITYMQNNTITESNKYFFKSITCTKNLILILKSVLRILNNLLKK